MAEVPSQSTTNLRTASNPAQSCAARWIVCWWRPRASKSMEMRMTMTAKRNWTARNVCVTLANNDQVEVEGIRLADGSLLAKGVEKRS